MIYFNNDYSEGCHPKVLEALIETNLNQTSGYGTDEYCQKAADKIRKLCGNDNLAVHFLVGGTQANLTVIDAALRPHQCVIGSGYAHIHAHETGAVEATGHKVITLPSTDGKISAAQIERYVQDHFLDEAAEHMTQPKMVYISNPTELGTIYSYSELHTISMVCRKLGLYLFVDGARLSYGLTANDNDIKLSDLAELCDVFYMGGTKCGALFGEAVVISNPELAKDFRYLIKQHGGMLAKGRLLGLQYCALLDDDTYFTIARDANALADQLRSVLKSLGFSLHVPGTTNQIFVVLPDAILNPLSEKFSFTTQERVSETHRLVRFCTSWATTQQNVNALCEMLSNLVANSDTVQ